MLLLQAVLGCFMCWLTDVKAQSSSDTCSGNTTTYTADNLTVSFNNLCGRDIAAPYDIASAHVKNFGACLDYCVKYQPLCYGFDSRPDDGQNSINCWIMGRNFPASSAINTTNADAAMLGSTLPTLADDCSTFGPQKRTNKSVYSISCGLDIPSGDLFRLPASSMADCLGLCDGESRCDAVAYESSLKNGFYNCFLKSASHGDTVQQSYTTVNAASRVSTITSSSSSTSATSTATTTTSTTASSSSAATASTTGLSDGTKAGIGGGVGAAAVVAILIAAWCVIRQRKRKQQSMPANPQPVAELPVSRNNLSRHEMESPAPSLKGRRGQFSSPLGVNEVREMG